MCGITGFNWEDKTLLSNLTSKIKHRGPDHLGQLIRDNVSLGHTRLSILDLSSDSNQPLISSDKANNFSIVFNGEIYNFKKVRSELIEKGFTFKTKGDAEVILNAYICWGKKCVHKFEGMWAFAIHDLKKKELFLSRDPIGIKPLYYYFEDSKFVFSSEIKPILDIDDTISCDEKTVFDFIYHDRSRHSSRTFFTKINMLLAGHNIILDLETNNLKLEKYFFFSKRRISNPKDTLRAELNRTIDKIMISDVPVSTSLSGGLDSSAITCMMSKRSKSKFNLYSLTFKNFEKDESKYQKIVAIAINHPLKSITFNPEDFFSELDELLMTQEEPFEGLARYGQYKIMEHIKKDGVKVVVDGQGADETFFGYPVFFGIYFSELFYTGRFIKLCKELFIFFKKNNGPEPLLFFFSTFIPNFLRNALWEKRKEYVSKKFFVQNKKRNVLKKLWQIKETRSFSKYTVHQFPLQSLLVYNDKNSMRFGIESRVPFCEHKLVDLAVSLPAHLKISEGETKRIMRDVLKKEVPSEIVERKDKVGFATPDQKIICSKRGKQEFEKIFAQPSRLTKKIWNMAKIKLMFEDHFSAKHDYSRELLKFLIVDRWYKLYFEK